MKSQIINALKSFNYYDEQIKLLFENRAGAFASNFYVPIGVAFMLSDYISHFILGLLTSTIFILGIVRLVSGKRGLKSIENKERNLTIKYMKLNIVLLFLTSIIYGIFSILTVCYGEFLHIFVMLTLFAALVAGATSTISYIFHAVIAYTIPFITLFIIGLILNFTPIYSVLIFALITFVAITIPSSFRFFSAFKESIEKNVIISEQKEQIVNNQSQLINSAKMASLGEMIANIAHQWRQPLSSISMICSSIQLENDLGLPIEHSELRKKMDTIVKNTNYLSSTIETFRNFLKTSKEVKEVVLQDRLELVNQIINTALKDAHIKFIIDDKTKLPIKKTMPLGELDQVIINIVNNAKDILTQNKIKNSWIKLELFKDDKNKAIVITLEDNGGGIPESIIGKVFDAYFTTKHQSKGTGLGLHMSYKIITESLKGNIYVNNTKNGAKFFIEIPLD